MLLISHMHEQGQLQLYKQPTTAVTHTNLKSKFLLEFWRHQYYVRDLV